MAPVKRVEIVVVRVQDTMEENRVTTFGSPLRKQGKREGERAKGIGDVYSHPESRIYQESPDRSQSLGPDMIPTIVWTIVHKQLRSFLDVSGTDEKAAVATNDIAQVQTKGVINEPED